MKNLNLFVSFTATIFRYLTLPTQGTMRSAHDATMHAKFGRGPMSVAVNGVKSGNGAATSSSAAAGGMGSAAVRGYSEGAVSMRRPGWNDPDTQLTESMIKKEGAWGEAPIHAGPRGHALRNVEDYAEIVGDDPAHLKYMAVHQKSRELLFCLYTFLRYWYGIYLIEFKG